jgi:hypothetical protein
VYPGVEEEVADGQMDRRLTADHPYRAPPVRCPQPHPWRPGVPMTRRVSGRRAWLRLPRPCHGCPCPAGGRSPYPGSPRGRCSRGTDRRRPGGAPVRGHPTTRTGWGRSTRQCPAARAIPASGPAASAIRERRRWGHRGPQVGLPFHRSTGGSWPWPVTSIRGGKGRSYRAVAPAPNGPTGKWQATWWPGATSRSRGSSAAHLSWA